MTDPPHEGYTWPVAPAGSRPPRERRPSRPPGEASTLLTRRSGVAAGTVFAVVAIWSTVFRGVEMPEGLVPLAVGVAVSAAAMSLPGLRSFAGGFLVASVVGGIVAFVALVVFLLAVFANMGP